MKLKGSIADNELVLRVSDFKMTITGRHKIQVIVVFMYCRNSEGLLLTNTTYKFHCEKTTPTLAENETGTCNQ